MQLHKDEDLEEQSGDISVKDDIETELPPAYNEYFIYQSWEQSTCHRSWYPWGWSQGEQEFLSLAS